MTGGDHSKRRRAFRRQDNLAHALRYREGRLSSRANTIPQWIEKIRAPWFARCAIVFAIYLLLTGVYTWPLLRNLGSRVPSDPADPVLTASVLWWNATTLPFSPQWWNAPHYYP